MTASKAVKIGDRVTLEEIEQAHIVAVLRQTRSLAEATQVLGIDAATLWRKRKKWGIPNGEELRIQAQLNQMAPA